MFRFRVLGSRLRTRNLRVQDPPGTAVAAGTEVESQSFQTTELDLPVSTAGILLLLGSVAVLIALTVRTALRDSRFLKARNRTILLIPRLLVLALVLLIVLNPQRRTQLSRVEKSRVGVLLDTSLSMAWPAAIAMTERWRPGERSAAVHQPIAQSEHARMQREVVDRVRRAVGTQQEARRVGLHVRFRAGRSLGNCFGRDSTVCRCRKRSCGQLQPESEQRQRQRFRWIRKHPVTASTISDPESLPEVEVDHPATRCGNTNR